MAEDEESMNNPIIMSDQQKPELTATSAVVVERDTGLSVGPLVGEESEVTGGAEAGPPMRESTVGDADEVEAVTETINEENETAMEKAEVALNAKGEVAVDATMEKGEVAEAVNVTKGETDSCVPGGDEKVVIARNENDGIVVRNENMEENIAVLEKDEVAEEAVNASKGKTDGCMTGGEKVVMASDEKNENVASNDNMGDTENGETVTEAVNAAKGEADSCVGDDEKVFNENENDGIVTRNDNMEDTKNGKTVIIEANVSTVEGSVSLGKDGENPVEAAKREEVGVPPIVLEKEDDAMGTDDVTGNTEKDDEMVSQVDISVEKDVEMDTMKHEEVEPVPLDEEEDKGTGAEDEVANGEKVVVTRNEEDDEMATRVDISAVEAGVESEKDVEMDTKKNEAVEPVPLDEDNGMAAEDEADNGEKVEEDDEMVTRVDTSAVETGIESEKDIEMDTVKDEEVEPVEGTGSKDEGANATTTEMDTMKDEEVAPVPGDEEEDDEGTGAEDEAANATTTEIETENEMTESGKSSGGKRKRKNNTKSTGKSKSGGRASSRKAIGEDVCFICFDGGDLVLCDRRGCTKAYHPSCIDRDEEFFRAKGKWNCGWHQCTICQKNATYLCYTCTFSLCKGCIKDDVILCVRGNKGFCKNCMKTVKLIEGLGKEDNDGPIDFDDKSSFEYLFKDYLMDLKAKLSLSSDEIADAKSPRKGADVSASKQELAEAQFDNNDDAGSGSDASIETLEASKTKRRKLRKRSKSLKKEEDATTTAVTSSEGFSTAGTTEWASKELLEFVKHMKSGDASVLSQFDVQALLLEYIKTNKLRDPRRKSQIICDSRLESLFGKPRVGHFEMLKLLESHFLMKEDSQTDDVQGSVVDTEFNQFEADANADTPTRGVKDRKRKRKKGENRGPQSNLDEYAAIDVHNISLIYLRRKLVEDLLEEDDKFHDKVVGTFLRIRISGNVQKQDLYRLVQVVGTSKAAEPYKLGKRTTDVALEILNLNKTEVLSIDTISNQDFTEEECKRLRQSIKCGLINRPTVGDILDKAMEIHAARVNDVSETEKLRLDYFY